MAVQDPEVSSLVSALLASELDWLGVEVAQAISDLEQRALDTADDRYGAGRQQLDLMERVVFDVTKGEIDATRELRELAPEFEVEAVVTVGLPEGREDDLTDPRREIALRKFNDALVEAIGRADQAIRRREELL
ncbi:hypothetical protein M9M90_01105 [Phenylobacterium sp. LH3H17]|uniref:hypothetical protein n=1 Tax=Phenylobacterium sp. LH3H17 TaxID=2903901 RepID=UPI0020C95E39|nr:hypothetical protein [Phenylobacterium sp. LH3H17]UTP39803.1 hypothetical protein M9M90_01105 [Phenylobacterium sp. LH3H17]